MFDWSDYLALARTLATGDEAHQRSAISRAYYAAFHAARRLVERAHPEVRVPRHGGNHEIVWAALRDGTRVERVAAIHGTRLRMLRAKADYELHTLRFPGDTKAALDAATAILSSFDAEA